MSSIVTDSFLPHPPAKVWNALTDPALLAAWLMPNDFVPALGHRFTFQTEPVPAQGFDGVIRCEVLTSGVMGSRRHINLPGVKVNLPPLTEKDLADVAVGAEMHVDFVALSFCREPGDVDVLLLDKTGTITLGNRQAAEFIPAPGVTEAQLADAAQLSSLPDETPEGRSIVVLAKERYGLRGRDFGAHEAQFVPFSAQTQSS